MASLFDTSGLHSTLLQPLKGILTKSPRLNYLLAFLLHHFVFLGEFQFYRIVLLLC